MRPTIQMTEPEIFITYALVLHCNLSPQRTMKLWQDTNSHYDKDQTGRGKVKGLVNGYLRKFWQAQPESNGVFSDVNEVIRFLHKHQKKWWRFW